MLYYSRPLLLLFIFLIGFPMPAAEAEEIQMLPPWQNNQNITCQSDEGNKVLTWDAASTIKCNSNVTIGNNGYLGIGTKTPSMPLHVVFRNNVEDGTNGRVVVENKGSANANFSTVVNNSRAKGVLSFSVGPFASSSNMGAIVHDHAKRQTQIWTQKNAGDWSPKFAVNRFGQVGIGIGAATPDAMLHVGGSILAAGTIKSKTKSNTYVVSSATLYSNQNACYAAKVITTDGAFSAYCVSACNRYCSGLDYSGGTITEWRADIKKARCLCSP